MNNKMKFNDLITVLPPHELEYQMFVVSRTFGRTIYAIKSFPRVQHQTVYVFDKSQVKKIGKVK